MVLRGPHRSLELTELPVPEPPPGEALVAVEACAVCRTDLHLLDGELPDIPYPLIPGHQVVGRIVGGAPGLPAGTRVGVPWLGATCGRCRYCRSGHENLCDAARFTGYTRPGGYAEYLVAAPRYCFALPEEVDALHIAPWLCAGLIGYRALRMCADAERIGIYGFGAAAHLLAQVLRFQGRRCYAFTRPGDAAAQAAATGLGAEWAGGSDETPPEELDAAIIFAPVGTLVPRALKAVRKAGVVVCGGIHMSDIPSFPYAWLWGERVIRSVANLTHADGLEFLALATRIPLATEVHSFPLQDANRALEALRQGTFTGSAVLSVGVAKTQDPGTGARRA